MPWSRREAGAGRRNEEEGMPGNDDAARRLVEQARREREERERGYRERALKLFPHVCGRCGREFEGRRLKELTVHHRNGDHDFNPPDGSNWELLCKNLPY